MEAENFRRLQPGIQHVIGVTDPCDGFAFDGTPMFDKGENVGKYLAWMVLVRQTVDDRHA